MSVIIPDWVARQPKPVDTTGQAPPGHANRAAQGSKPSDLQIPSIGREQIIPIVYGGPERMAGLVYCVATPKTGTLKGKLVFAAILCEGEVEDVSGFEVNGEAVPTHIKITAYKGAPGQGVDPWLAAAIPGFAETLPGVAYFVAQVAPTDSTGFPTITALVKGFKVVDQRTMFYHVWKDFVTTVWSTSGAPPDVVHNTDMARDNTVTAHSIVENASGLTGSRDWFWPVPNDSLKRNISISLNKALVTNTPGIAVDYSGGTPVSYTVRLDLGTGVVTPISGTGTHQVREYPNHWEVILSLTNNHTGNTQFRLRLYPLL